MSERAIVDQRQGKKAKQYEKLALERERTDLQSILGTVHGRRFLWGLLSDCGVFRISLAHGQPDVTGFNEGRRSIGLAYMAKVSAIDPKSYHLMAQEAHDLEQAYTLSKQDPVEKDTDEKETDDATD